MSESERRRKYRYDRVLIETARVLDPQFDDAVVYLTGAQIEMLRNMTQYLNNLDTYVSEQFLGYYLAPTVEEYDSILAIVADLEETLMGNPNTIFGYYDVFSKTTGATKSGDGDKTLYGEAVPEGEIWRIEGITVRNEDTICTRIDIIAHYFDVDVIVCQVDSPEADAISQYSGLLTMKEGDTINCTFHGCLDGDVIRFWFHGYITAVP